MINLNDHPTVGALHRKFNPTPEDFSNAYHSLRDAAMNHPYFLAIDRPCNPDMATATFIDISVDPDTITGHLEAFLIIVRLGSGDLKIIDGNGEERFLGTDLRFFDFRITKNAAKGPQENLIKEFVPNIQRLYTAFEIPGDDEHGDILEDASATYLHPTCAAQLRVLETLFTLYATPDSSRRYAAF